MSHKKHLVLVFLFFLISPLFAQPEQGETFKLIEILQILEDKYDYSFAYADKDLQEIEVPEPPNMLSFTETIAFLEGQTGFEFTMISDKQIAVKATSPILPEKNEIPIEELEEVILTNVIAQGVSKRKDGSFEMNYEKFGTLPGLIEPDVFQTLQALPGVESVNETVSNLNIRGGTNDQNLILWDGIRIYQNGHFFGLISAINPHQNKKAVLYKNGTPAKFGNSVSSVIKLSSEDKVNDKFTAEVGTTFLSIDAYVDTPLDEKSSLQFSARSSINGAFVTPTYLQYYDRAFQQTEISTEAENVIKTNEDFKFSDISFRWLYQLTENDLLRLNYFYITNDLELTANEFNNTSTEIKKSSLSQNSLGMGVFYKRDWSSSLTSSLQLYHTNYNLNSSNQNETLGTLLDQENKIYENSAKINVGWKISSQFQLQSGYEFTATKIENAQANTEITNEDTESDYINSSNIFSSLKLTSANKNTVAELGTRLNYFNKFKMVLAEPRVSFNQKFLKNFSVEALGELKSQSISQLVDFQNDFLGIENRKWQLSNQEDIPLLRSRQFSLGLHYQKNKWLGIIEGYAKRVNGISSQSQGFQNQFEFAQVIGDYRTKGVDFLVSKKIDRFDARISYSLTENDYFFDDFSNNSIPNNFEIVNSFTFATSYTYKDFSVSSGFILRSGKPFTAITPAGLENNQFDYEPVNSSNLPNYFRLDISASQKFKIQEKLNAYAGISIWNLLDRNNIVNAYYRQTDNQLINLVEQKALGLTPNFVFRVVF